MAEVLRRHCLDGANRLDNFIQDLLEYTRDSSDSIADPSPISLDTVVRHLLNLLAPSIQEVAATVTTCSLPSLQIQAITRSKSSRTRSSGCSNAFTAQASIQAPASA